MGGRRRLSSTTTNAPRRKWKEKNASPARDAARKIICKAAQVHTTGRGGCGRSGEEGGGGGERAGRDAESRARVATPRTHSVAAGLDVHLVRHLLQARRDQVECAHVDGDELGLEGPRQRGQLHRETRGARTAKCDETDGRRERASPRCGQTHAAHTRHDLGTFSHARATHPLSLAPSLPRPSATPIDRGLIGRACARTPRAPRPAAPAARAPALLERTTRRNETPER